MTAADRDHQEGPEETRDHSLASLPCSDEQSLYRREWARIRSRRWRAFGLPPKPQTGPAHRPEDQVGLALSGGGLRSALFNDGFLQALSHRGLLRYVDYLCSVSGGGYIAGHLMTYATAKRGDSADDATECGQHPEHSDAPGRSHVSVTDDVEGLPEPDPAASHCFHDGPPTEQPDWYFGRHPDTGLEARHRLPGIGGYLNQSLKFFAGFGLRMIPTALFYISLTGLIATCLALYFRSFDEPLFRTIYLRLLQNRFGDELFLALVPSLLTLVATLFLATLAWTPPFLSPWTGRDRCDDGQKGAPLPIQKTYLRPLAKLGFWLFVFFFMVGIAVYLGNDLTKATSNRNVPNHHRLNQFALQMTILAAVVQLLVFLGRDRLFRSEKSDASKWRKVTQAVVTNGVVAFMIFTMIHVMARENISRYTQVREPYLVCGDVVDWDHLASLFQAFETFRTTTSGQSPESKLANQRPDVSPFLRVDTWAERSTAGQSGALRYWRSLLSDNETSIPESPAETRDRIAKHLPGGIRRYAYTMLSFLYRPWFKGFSIESSGKLVDRDHIVLPAPYGPIGYREIWEVTDRFHANQQRYLTDHNAILESAWFTDLLLAQAIQPEKTETSTNKTATTMVAQIEFMKTEVELTESTKSDADEAITGPRYRPVSWPRLAEQPHLTARIARLSAADRNRIASLLDDHDLKILPGFEPVRIDSVLRFDSQSVSDGAVEPTGYDAPWARWVSTVPQGGSLTEPTASDRVRLNRYLLELLTGTDAKGIIQAIDIASTWVVQPHDQAARVRWAIFWIVLLAIALLLTRDLNRVNYLFDYYRQTIGGNFLAGRSGGIDGSTRITDMTPEKSGLPIPIFLTTWLKEACKIGSGRVPVPVAISPDGVTVRDDQTIVTQASFADPWGDREIRLADAVAASGAAVTPMMTNSTALWLLMDFFSARLGFWMRWNRPKEPREPGNDTARTTSGAPADADEPAPAPSTRRPTTLPLTPDRARLQSILRICLWLPMLCVGALACYGLILALFVNPIAKVWLLPVGLSVLAGLAVWQINTDTGYPAYIRALVRSALLRSQSSSNRLDRTAPDMKQVWPTLFISDGGFCDYLGVTELLHRRCELIIVSDAGINTGATSLESLATMCERASSQLGVRFFDLDHDTPVEFARLRKNDQEMSPQAFLAIRIKYPADGDSPARDGLMFYVQMTITERDPIEIQQVRHRFPSFPDEPTTNQFYTPDQVAAYRDLGYHIGNRLCSNLQRWTAAETINAATLQAKNGTPSIDPAIARGDRQPLIDEIRRRLKRSYVQACYEEFYFSEHDVYGESIWRDDITSAQQSVYPTFAAAAARLRELGNRPIDGSDAADRSSIAPIDHARYWLSQFTDNADVRARYMAAINIDVNRLSTDNENVDEKLRSNLSEIFVEICPVDDSANISPEQLAERKNWWLAHLTVVAAAAQQLHRGSPHAVFQVGGREKLCGLLQHLVNDIVQVIEETGDTTDGSQVYPPALCDRLANHMVHEIFELSESVFQSADRATVVSFVQCLCKELAAWETPARLGGLPADWIWHQRESEDPTESNGNSETHSLLLPLDFRQLFVDTLETGYRSHARRLIARYLQALLREGEIPYRSSPHVATHKLITPASPTTRNHRPR